jgi:hypothetical protein
VNTFKPGDKVKLVPSNTIEGVVTKIAGHIVYVRWSHVEYGPRIRGDDKHLANNLTMVKPKLRYKHNLPAWF